ncbi:MAG: penicillin-binding protein 2 [Actinomycetes bacterium]|jgi:cell division protein FtsI (penicillin-binding protein 3)|nr:penicillin-binding protein 2 [Actinomycetes bacterium]
MSSNKLAGSPGILRVITGVLLLCLVAAAGRFIQLQVVYASRLSAAAESQRLLQTELPAKRGTVTDRNGSVLAQSVQTYDVIADPRNLAKLYSAYTTECATAGTTPQLSYEQLLDQMADTLSVTFNEDRTRVRGLLENKQKSGTLSRYALLAKKTASETRDAYLARASAAETDTAEVALYKRALRNISFKLVYKRVYPQNTVGAQIIGFLSNEGTGTAGIEQRYDELLAGTPGVTFSERDKQGNLIPSGKQKTIEPVNGPSIMLTIDNEIQYQVQAELKAAVKKYKAAGASAIVMDPSTGEIYASASYPTFDPNKRDKMKPESLQNAAFVNPIEPGSTMKTVTLAGALDAGVVTTKTKFKVPWRITVGTRTVKDSHEHGTQTMTVSKIIEQSSNVGTTRIAQKVGSTKYYQILRQFKITQTTGIDYPGAGKGQVLTPDDWSDVSLSNMSFGQGLSMTPLQLARAVAAIANDGVMTTPHLLKDIPDGSHELPEWPTERVMSSDAAADANTVLKRVMTKGTGSGVQVPGYTVAGKTGTAQKAKGGSYVDGAYVSSFIGYLPADDPKLLVYVLLDEPKAGYYGAQVAGPSFANIATFAARQLELTPDAP